MADKKLRALKQALLERSSRTVAIHSLNTLLEASSSTRIREIAAYLSFQLLFESLSQQSSDGSGDHLQVTCAAMWKIFSVLPAREVCDQRLYLELGLQHASEHVRKLSLNTICKHLKDAEVVEMVTASTMFHLVTQLLSDESLECAKVASSILFSLLRDPSSLSEQLKTGLLLDWEAAMGKSEIVRFRVYELALQLSRQGSGLFQFVTSSGLLERLLEELGSLDILVQMNCVEMLLPLMETKEGLDFLKSKGVVAIMHGILLSAQHDPLGAAALIPSIHKFFGHILLSPAASLDLIQTYPEFLRSILSACLSPEDATQWGVAVDTLGVLGSTPHGRAALQASGNTATEVMQRLGGVMAEGPSDLRVRVLHSLTYFFSLCESPKGVTKSVEWFYQLHVNPLAVVLSIAKQPFADLRASGLKLLLALSPHKWAQQEMTRLPGFVEYLLDRRTEPDKEGKELKHDIVHSLVASATAESVFGSVNYLQLRKYDREGPFFFTGEQAIASKGSV